MEGHFSLKKRANVKAVLCNKVEPVQQKVLFISHCLREEGMESIVFIKKNLIAERPKQEQSDLWYYIDGF